jgi:hypothetical protein
MSYFSCCEDRFAELVWCESEIYLWLKLEEQSIDGDKVSHKDRWWTWRRRKAISIEEEEKNYLEGLRARVMRYNGSITLKSFVLYVDNCPIAFSCLIYCLQSTITINFAGWLLVQPVVIHLMKMLILCALQKHNWLILRGWECNSPNFYPIILHRKTLFL